MGEIMKIAFSLVPVGAVFTYNGNACLKKSTRTARLIEVGRVFYFRNNEIVTI